MNCQCEHVSHFDDDDLCGCKNEAAVQVSASYALCIECVNAEHMIKYLKAEVV